MKKPIIWPWAVAMLLVACSHPVGVRGPQQAGSVRVALKDTVLSTSARTVVADASDAGITSCTVELTSHDGYASQSQTVSWGSAANFAIVQAGTWDIFVAAFSASGQAAAGSATGQIVTAGSDLSLTVPLSMTQTGQGGFSLVVEFPNSVDITSVSGTLENASGSDSGETPTVSRIIPVEGSPTMSQVTFRIYPYIMFTVSGTFRKAMMAAARWLRATKLRSSFSYRTSSFRKRLNQLWHTLTTQRLAFLFGLRRLRSASVRRSTT
jgi:hypothetical protein